jgi:broad specificity phosphatase PhoE
MKSKLFLLRHGQTIWKRFGITHGQKDSPLSVFGRIQMHRAADKLSKYSFKHFLVSPLGQAVDSALILQKKLDLPAYELNDLLVEAGKGVFEGLEKTQQQRLYPDLFDQNGSLKKDALIPGAESTEDFRKRMILLAEYLKNIKGNILVVTHSGVIRMLKVIYKKLDREQFKFIKVSYGEILTLDN